MEFKFIDKEEYIKRIGEFQKLFKDCFNREITREFLIWRYINNPINEMFVNVALENNKVIANYSVSPFKLSINGSIEKAALSMTTMTHPNFRKRGIFIKLAGELYEKMEKSNYKVVIGFPNNNSHIIFVNKLRWKNIYEIPTMKLDLLKLKDFNIYNNFNIINDKDFSLNYSKLISGNNNKIKLYKNLEYLKWRYRDSPINKYDNYALVKNGDVVSSIVIKKFNHYEIDIVDINSLNDFYTKELLSLIIRKGKNENIKNINMWCQLDDSMHSIAENIGFSNHEPISYFGIRTLKEQSGYISDYSNWHIQMGDSDVY